MISRVLGGVCSLLDRLAAALLFLALACASTVFAATPPNIIIILADDFGFGDVSAFGSPVQTLNLDRLAREGARFTQAYVAAPICSPSRCGLLTGQHPGRWRINSFLQTRAGNRACGQDDFLDPKAPTLPRALQAAGYATAHVGKWHLGGGRDVTNAPPFAAYGYDSAFGTYESPEPHPDITATNWIWSAHDLVKRHDRTRWMVDRTLDFLRARKGKPCFINLWLDDTHTPFVPSREQLAAVGVTADKPSEQQRFRAVLHDMDFQIGRFMQELRELGIDRDTLVLFLGDNGALPHYGGARNGGLRGSKLSLYEGGVRVPLIAHWPGRIPAGRVNDETVISALDFLPTLCQIARAKMPPGKFDGMDMSHALFGKTPSRRTQLFFEYGRNTNSFAYPREPHHRSPNLAVRDGKWKLLVNADGTGAELFDILADPKETADLASQNPRHVQRLTRAALAWRKSLP